MNRALASLGPILLALVPSRVAAQDDPSTLMLQPGVQLEEHPHRAFGPKDGLPSGWIHDLLQSRDGYVWVGTHNGLARFDGTRFTVYDVRNTPELPGSETRRLLESRDGSLWIGGPLGLARYRPGRPGVFETVPELREADVRAIYEDRAGGVWVGTRRGLWHAPDATVFRQIEGSPEDLRAICQDEAGSLWLGSDSGLFVREGARFVRAAEELLPARDAPNFLRHGSEVTSLHHDRMGLWIGTQRGLLRYTQGRFEPQLTDTPPVRVHELLRTRDGRLYAALGRYLARSRAESFETLPTHRHARALLEDREGGLWVGFASDAGLHRYQTPRAGAALTDLFVTCVREDGNGTIWFGADSGLYALADDTLTCYGLEQGLLGQMVRTIVPADGDALWIGGSGGLARWADGEITPVTHPRELVGMSLRAALQDASGTLWLARWGQGTFVLREGELLELEPLAEGETHWFHEDADGRVWIGHQTGVYRGGIDHLERVRDPELDRLSPTAFGHYAAPNGDLWIATGGGVARHRGGRFDVFTMRDGLAAEYIERLCADRHGNLWMGGRHGFFYARLEDMDDFAAGRSPSFTSHRIERDQGMSTLSRGHGFPNTWLASDGTLYLPALEGVVTVSSEHLQRRGGPPTVSIERVLLNGETQDATGSLAFTSGSHRLTVQFATPSFAAPERVRARYRIDGHDDEWIDAGSERLAQYTDLSPGEYLFRFVAENEHGVRGEEKSLRFSVEPRWWEILWVRALILAALVTLIGLGFQARTHDVQRRNRLLRREIAERERAEEEARRHWEQLGRVSRAASMGEITTSIAHEVKQPLFAIVSNAQTARRLLEREEPDRDEALEALEDIASDGMRASEIIDRIRSLVRKEHGPTEELDLNEVARGALRLVEPEIRRRGLTLQSDLADELPHVAGDRIELQQVLINLILNGAQAMEDVDVGALRVSTSATDGQVTVTVEDQGVGLDEERARRAFEPFYTTRPQGIGMGLAINRAIIEHHGGRIQATPNEGPGATFEFSLPCKGPAS